MAPSSTVTAKRGTVSPGMVMHTPERRSNSQPCSGQVTMSPSMRPSQRLPPLWAHSLPMAKISSPRLKSATSIPRTTTSSTLPGGSAARSKTRVRDISPSPCPLPYWGRGFRLNGTPAFCIPLPRWGRIRLKRTRTICIRVRGGLIRLVEDFDQVEDLDRCALGGQALGDLDDAAGIGGDDGLGARGANVGDLARLQALRHLGLGQVVRPGRAAAPISLGQRYHGEPGNLGKESSRLAADLLAVHDVTRIVIGHRLLDAAERSTQGLGGQELGEVTHALRKALRPLTPCGIVGQEQPVGLHVGATARSVHDHDVDPGLLEDLDEPLGERDRQGVLAPMRVKRSAARLGPRRHDLGAIPGENTGRRSILGAEGDLLDAPGEKTDPRAPGAHGRRQLGQRGPRGAGRQHGKERLPVRQGPGQEADEASRSRESLQAARLVEAQTRGGEAEQPRAGKEHTEIEPAEEAPRDTARALALDRRAPGLDELAVRHARWTDRLAGAAAEAEIEM